MKEKQRRRKHDRRNQDQVSTDEEDVELENEMEAELVEDELVVDSVRLERTQKPGRAKLDKGKGRAVEAPTTAQDDDLQPAVSEPERKKPGPLSKAAQDEIDEFTSIVLSAADNIAHKYDGLLVSYSSRSDSILQIRQVSRRRASCCWSWSCQAHTSPKLGQCTSCMV